MSKDQKIGQQELSSPRVRELARTMDDRNTLKKKKKLVRNVLLMMITEIDFLLICNLR